MRPFVDGRSIQLYYELSCSDLYKQSLRGLWSISLHDTLETDVALGNVSLTILNADIAILHNTSKQG